MRNEKAVEKLLIDACKEMDIRQHKGESNGNIGFPDRVVYNHITKKILHVEVKYGSSYKQTRKQQIWQKTIENSGGNYFLITGKNEMLEFIENHIKKEVE